MQVIIYKRPEDGGVSIMTPVASIDKCMRHIPEGAEYKIIDSSALPQDQTFRDCWTMDEHQAIVTRLDLAKEQAHKLRREVRAKEFEPYDEVIMKQIPGNDYTQAEANRQTIRTKYETIQTDIDNAETEADLIEVYKELL